MDEIMDQLNQVIEERVLELKRKSGEDKVPAYCIETKEHVLRMDRILNSLSEDDRQWLDDQLMAKMDIPEQELLSYGEPRQRRPTLNGQQVEKYKQREAG